MKQKIKPQQFKTKMDYITYRITGKTPDYLNDETEDKKAELIFYKHKTSKGDRGMIVCKDNKKSLCSCYEKDYPKIMEEFHKEYDGTNFDEIAEKYKKKYNLKKFGTNGKRRIERLEDCNIRFNRRKGSDRIDVRTHLYGKEYPICRCYEHEIPKVRKDFKRMQKNPNFTIEKISEKMKRKYNLQRRQSKKTTPRAMKHQHTITITEDGLIYQDGKFIKTNNKIYGIINSLI